MYRIIGNKIRAIRTLKNLSQEYVAHKLGVSQNYYSKIERGSSPINDQKLSAIASIMEVSKEDILNYHEDNYIRTQSLKLLEEKVNLILDEMDEIKKMLQRKTAE